MKIEERIELKNGSYKIIEKIQDKHHEGTIRSVGYYNYKNELHREDGPAYIIYDFITKYKSIFCEKYYINGKIHRENGPAFITYYANGDIKNETHYINGECHKEDGPAVIKYNTKGDIECQEYRLNNECHREDGPAIINKGNKYYSINGNFMTSTYYKYRDELNLRKIKLCNDIDKLKIFKIICLENKNSKYEELLTEIETKIITLKLANV